MILKYLLTTLNICGLFCLFTTPIVASAASTVKTVMVNDAGEVVLPQKFAEKNNLVTNEVVCLRIDMLDIQSKVESTNDDAAKAPFTDAELKILDGEGNLLYFATTLQEDVADYHSDDGTHDANCKIYYYVSGKHYNSAPGGCSNPKQKYTLKEGSIGGKESEKGNNGKIIAIEFYPDLPGKLTVSGVTREIRDVVLNPNNTIIVSRKGDAEFEKDTDGNRIWRPVTIQYYTIPLDPSSNGSGN